MCKVQWSHHTKEEATWEREEELKAEFPSFFLIHLNIGDQIHFKGERFVTPCFHNRMDPRNLLFKNNIYLIIASHAAANFLLY
jgi:hypothetical protein